MAAPFTLTGRVHFDDSGLAAHAEAFSRATGKPILEVARQNVIKPLLRTAIDYTPPGSDKTKGLAAKRAGEAAVIRDFARAGFSPVEIKGYRTLDHVFSHKLDTPLRIPTKINPRFADVEAIRQTRMKNRHGGKVTRGGKQAWYVDRSAFNTMKRRVLAEIGRLASGWALAALEVGLSVPAFIKRHIDLGRGTKIIAETPSETRVRLVVINHFPPGSEDIAADMERRLSIFAGYVKNGLVRQLKYFYAHGWESTARA